MQLKSFMIEIYVTEILNKSELFSCPAPAILLSILNQTVILYHLFRVILFEALSKLDYRYINLHLS